MNLNNIENVIYSVIEKLNKTLPKEEHLEKSLLAPIYGRNGKLDSLGLVNLILTIEQQIEDEYGLKINLADERAVSQKNSPFESVETLTNYIAILLDKQMNN